MSCKAERNRRNGTVRPGDMPAPDGYVVDGKPRRRAPYWLVQTIADWDAARPRTVQASRNLPDGMKVCSKCGETKPLDEYHRWVDTRRGGGPRYQAKCKTCHMQIARDWNQRNPGRANENNLAHRKRYKRRYKAKMYGLTEIELAAMEAAQQGHCLICREFAEDGLVIDHDHTGGHVRGLLCNLCNLGLGAFRDDPRRLLTAIRYLEVGRRGVFDRPDRAGGDRLAEAVPEQPPARQRQGDRRIAAA